MLKKRIIGIFLSVIGIFLIVNSQANITGNVMGAASYSINISIGFIFLAAGMMLLLISENNIEAKIDEYEANTEHGKVICMRGIKGLEEDGYQLMMTERELTANEEKRYVNLKQFKNLVELMGPLEKEANCKALREKVKAGYNNAFERISKNIKLDEKQKENLRKALAAERVIDAINPEYKTRQEKLMELRKNRISAEPHIYKPIVAGKAAYVHYNSKDEIKSMEEGKIFDGQALYFSKLEDAEEFVKNTSQAKAKKLTGARFTEKAAVFQTYDPPEKINTLSGEATPSMRKAFFKELEKGEIYNFREYNVSR